MACRFTLVVRAAAADNVYTDKEITFVGVDPPVWITPLSLSAAGTSVSIQLDASGAAAFALVDGALPADCSLSASGTLSGTVTEDDMQHEWAFVVRAFSIETQSVYTDRPFTLAFSTL